MLFAVEWTIFHVHSEPGNYCLQLGCQSPFRGNESGVDWTGDFWGTCLKHRKFPSPLPLIRSRVGNFLQPQLHNSAIMDYLHLIQTPTLLRALQNSPFSPPSFQSIAYMAQSIPETLNHLPDSPAEEHQAPCQIRYSRGLWYITTAHFSETWSWLCRARVG